MSLKQLSQADFAFWKKYNDDMRHCHEKEFIERIDPDLMRALYRGKRVKEETASQFQSDLRNDKDRLVTLNRIFNTTNTILPNVYNQNPKKLAIPTKGHDPDSAALMTAILNYYIKKTKQKQENQETIMNAWFFGLGWKKLGYHIATESDVKGPESKLSIMDKASLGIKSILGIEPELTTHKTVPDIVRYETLVNTSEDPMNVLIDHKADLRTYKVITHRIKRSLFDILNFNNYETSVVSEMIEALEIQRGTRFDIRDVEVDLNEMMIEQRNGIWILVWVDQFPKPLRYELMTTKGSLPWSPLSLTNEPGVRYPIAHMKVASGVQEWIDNLVNLQIDIIGKSRSQHIVNEDAFAKGQMNAFRRNRIGGIIRSKRPLTSGDVVELSSKGIGSDQFATLQLFQQNLTEILGSTEQRVSGKSRNRTLGQDELAEVGGQIRESGVLDRVKDWMIDQTEKEGEFIKQYSNASLHLRITNKDFSDPRNGQLQEEKWVEFNTQNQPLPISHFIQGEFEYDVNVYEAIKPNKPQIRREYLEAMTVLAPLQQHMIQQGSRIKLDVIAKGIGKTFEHIDSNEFIEELDPQQQSALQALEVLKQTGGVVPQELGGSEQEVNVGPGGGEGVG